MINSNDDKEVKKSSQVKKDCNESQSLDLEKITDYAPEKAISEHDAQRAIDIIDNIQSRNLKSEKDKELAKVVCKKEDIELIVKEMEISKSKAEQCLRECGGNVVLALEKLTN